MLLPLYSRHHHHHHHPSFSPKTLNPSSFPSQSPKTTLPFQNSKPSKPPLSITCSSTNSETLTITKTAIKRITEKLKTLGYLEESKKTETPKTGHGSAGEIFLPSAHELPKHRVGHTIDTSWSTPEGPIPKPGTGVAIRRFHELRREVRKQKKVSAGEDTGAVATLQPTVAEMTIPAEELRRLRNVGIKLDKRLKVGKAGITEGIVNGIHERWRRTELVKIKCEDLCRLNMKRTHEMLERKTGGLVVWRSGSIIILYRGTNYKYPYFYSNNNTEDATLHDKVSLGSGVDHQVYDEQEANTVGTNSSAEPIPSNTLARPSLVYGVGSPKKLRFQLPGEAQLEEEADRLLDGLGPRFTDWWGYEPLPVDADLLPAIVRGYRRPFRLLPYGVKPKLTDQEMTTLRRLGRPLPCHFALGRNRNLQGLAASMVKLWEKCEIAKIAVKRGIQNTNSEIMADELKWLTGGSLLSRDREFIVFYRGKDFLPPAVSMAIEQRRKYSSERPRLDQNSFDDTMPKLEVAPEELALVDKLQEANDQKRDFSLKQRKLTSMNSAVKSMDKKLSLTLEKKVKAEKLLAELEEAAELKKPEIDQEGISKEERYMLRKVGLRMKPFLLLGRRGVFDGTIENMHLHWKYRELIKIISKDRSIEDVHSTARTLEAESGGILVAVERVSKGHAIIIYRGKNYERPDDLRPQTLLNKREAMKCSLEAQRRESLKLHVLNLTRNIDQLKLKLVKEDTETNYRQSTECRRSDTDFETRDQSGSVESAYHQENVEAKEWHNADASSLDSTESLLALSDNEENASTSLGIDTTFHVDDMNVKLVDSFSGDEDELIETELESSSEADLSKTYSNIFPGEIGYIPGWLGASREGTETVGTSDVMDLTHLDHMKGKSDSFSNDEDEFVDTDDGAYASDKELHESTFETARKELYSYGHKDPIIGEEGSNVKIPFRPSPLSNRDRLVLRKQALSMKKRPVLSIGRNNFITGVAKAIKNHFRRYPLAIVNVKGRAKGTSVQEVIFKLEQETGAVLVSREPNKVILYRGWGKGEEPYRAGEKKDETNSSESRNASGGDVISPKLVAAVRLECGLPSDQEEEDTP